MKKFTSLLIALLMIISMIPSSVMAEADITRYTVLVLDTSGTADFIGRSGQTIYSANSAVEYVKKSANKFTEDILSANGTNYVAVVSYKATAQEVIDFTDDNDSLKDSINALSASSTTRDISAGLKMANEMISGIDDDKAIKNVVLVTTGMTNNGQYNYSGHYDESTIGSIWRRTDNQVRLYAYANVAYAEAQKVKEKANLYTLGIFQTMSNMPQEGKEIAEFFKLTALDLASSKEFFYDIEDPEEIEFTFGEIVEDITAEDRDGDGLYDDWEINGVDTDNDGTIDLHLEKMGADPDVPDIFVEVDWMVRPSEKVSFVETLPELSYAPSENAMRIVYNSFKDHGINIHIDAGPDSTDFVTGKKWGKLSGGNAIDYEENFILGLNHSHWSEVVEDNFDTETRGNVFRHSMFIDRYNNGTSSGIANGIPGQYFIIANQTWLRNTGDTGIAGTFMHELGHTLGLSHGGHDNNVNNHTHYKPNYLSVMNYLFQTSGLAGTGAVNYSDYALPYLDENNLCETEGIDPEGLTENTGLGTVIKSNSYYYDDRYIAPVSKVDVDFDNSGEIDTETVSKDLNADGRKENLSSSDDWEHIVYKSGDIGEKKQIIHIAGIDGFSDEEKTVLEEVTLEERLENQLLTEAGTGALEFMGPFTLIEGYNNQKIIVRVSNMSAEDTVFTLITDESKISESFSQETEIKGSVNEINYTDIEIPVKDAPEAGKYSVKATLKSSGCDDVTLTFNVVVYNPTAGEMDELQEILADDESDMPDYLKEQYSDTFGEFRLTVEAETGGKIISDETVYANENDVIEIEAKANNGYKFKEWVSSNGGTFEDSDSISTTFTVPANDTVITAKFEKIKSSGGGAGPAVHTIKFDTNGGSKIADRRVIRDGVIEEPNEPVKEGYVFGGWYTDEDLTAPYDFSQKVKTAFTLYAKWNDPSSEQIILKIESREAQVFGEYITNDVAPKIVNDRTMLPIRFIAEALGAKVKWNEAQRSVIIEKDDIKIVIYIDSDKAIVNNKTVTLDSPAFIENDRTYLPLRFVSENLGADVEWIEKTQEVIITR